MWPKAEDFEYPTDTALVAQLATAGVTCRRMPVVEHRRWEVAWRELYQPAFARGSGYRHGAKAVDTYLREPATHWLLVPFLSGVPGTSVTVVRLTANAYECDGPLLELGDFINVEFFVSPVPVVDVRPYARGFHVGRPLLHAGGEWSVQRHVSGHVTVRRPAVIALPEMSPRRFLMIKAALKQLLNRLDSIGEQDNDITDTDVREVLVGAIYNGYFVQTPGYVLPEDYSLFKVKGCNQMVRDALAEFIDAAAASGPADPHERFAQFQDEGVTSDGGHDFNWYFATSDSLEDLAVFAP